MGKVFRHLSLILIIMSLAGCGGKGEKPVKQEETEAVYAEETESFDRASFDWRTAEWKPPKATNARDFLYVQSYSEGQIEYQIKSEDQLLPYLDEKIYGASLYILDLRESSDGDGQSYFVDRYDGENGTCSPTELAELTGELSEGEHCNITSFDVKEENEFVFLREVYSDGALCGLTAVHTDSLGNVQKAVDLYPGFVESGLHPVGEMYRDKEYILFELRTDRDGFYYLMDGACKRLLVMDGDGRVCCGMGLEEEAASFEFVRDSDGGLVIRLHWQTDTPDAIYQYDAQKRDMRQLTAIDGRLIWGACITEDGFCYFSDTTSLYQWDLCTGALKTVFNLRSEGITENGGMVYLAADPQGNILLYLMRPRIEMYVMSWEEPSGEGYMKILSLRTDCGELRAAAADYTRRNREDGVFVDADPEDEEDRRTRLLADMTAGKGPEAMYVSGADMEMLYEKGLLADLTGVLSPETESQIFPGVLDCGKIDGKQIGFPMTAQLSTVLVHRDVWSGDRWSVEDVVALIESGEYPELETIIGIAPVAWSNGLGEIGILHALTLMDVEHSPFLDMEKGECNFDSPEFIELLELISRYSKKNYLVPEADLLEQGRMLAYLGDTRDVVCFSATMAELGEDYHCVGFPVEDGNGCYWNCDYYLVVNGSTDRMDTVRGLMEYVYSYNRQMRHEMPLRRDVYSDSGASYLDMDRGYYYLHKGDMTFRPLAIKSDGSSWLDEFLELADKSTPYPEKAEEIREIVREEAQAFFDGSRDAAAVADVIQSRVWLYLQEGQ